MDEQVRRLSAQYGWNLSEDEIHRIVAEAAVQEKVLERLKQIDLAQTRPVMGVFKAHRSSPGNRRRK